MKARLIMAGIGLAGAAVVVGQMNSTAGASSKVVAATDTGAATTVEGGIAGGGAGPDVIVGGLTGPANWGSAGNIVAYSVGTTSCNIGTTPLQWLAFNGGGHPVIGQNLFRLKNGRFEQVGQSWLKHGFCALQQGLCGACQPFGPCCCDHLGVGCSDPYSPTRNGDQDGNGGSDGGLGPKFQVNAATGSFPFPYAQQGVSGNAIFKRLQVAHADVDPAQNAGARYFIEGQYVAGDDAAAGNKNNNASFREVLISPGTFAASFATGTALGATTQQMLPAIQAWDIIDPGVTINTVEVPNDGRFILGFKVTDNGNGTWDYEYAVHNLNSHRSARRFTLPVGDGVNLTNIGFHDVPYHSGDGPGNVNFDGTDWPSTVAGGTVSWSTGTAANANALRWGTLYNFRFRANAAPVAGNATITMYQAGSPASVNVATMVPGGGAACVGDLNDSDGVDAADLALLLGAWSTSNPNADLNDSGNVDAADLALLLGNWGDC